MNYLRRIEINFMIWMKELNIDEIDLLKRIKNMIAISASIIIPEYEEYIEEKWSISLDLCMLIKKL